MSAINMTEAVSKVNDTTTRTFLDDTSLVMPDGTTFTKYFYEFVRYEIRSRIAARWDGIPRRARELFSRSFWNDIPTRLRPIAEKCVFDMVLNNEFPQLLILSEHELPKKYYVADLTSLPRRRNSTTGTRMLIQGIEVNSDLYHRVERHLDVAWAKPIYDFYGSRHAFYPGFWRQLTTKERYHACLCVTDIRLTN